jgi:transposase
MLLKDGRIYTSPCENPHRPSEALYDSRVDKREVRMGRFIEGADRQQATLLPDTIEDYVGEENPVRVIDAFVEVLDLAALGFNGVMPEETGRPSYHPATMLKIYVYGYLNQVQSSRGLERECHRNLELIWLTGRLAPDFKTIADFRRNNGPAIRRVCTQFVALCRNLNLLDVASVAIDGSKFRAVNHREKNFTQDRLKRRMAAIEGTIDRYLAEIDRADRQHEVTGIAAPAAKVEHLKRSIETLQQKLKSLAALEAQMHATGEQQISLTDPDARAMTSQSHSAYVVGYNVQSAVDTQNHIIVTHEVSNVGIDKGHLSSMAGKARDALEAESIEVLADRGYFKSEEIAACEEAGIEAYVPKPLTSNARAYGRFDRSDFAYDRESNSYICPAGEKLTYRMTTTEAGKVMHRYWTNVCEGCALKQHCTTSKQRRVARWEHEDVLERAQERLDRRPDAMIVRRSTVEHPFASIKAWMGATHFRMKTLKHVATEMALHVLAYNLKRVMVILGVRELLRAM